MSFLQCLLINVHPRLGNVFLRLPGGVDLLKHKVCRPLEGILWPFLQEQKGNSIFRNSHRAALRAALARRNKATILTFNIDISHDMCKLVLLV